VLLKLSIKENRCLSCFTAELLHIFRPYFQRLSEYLGLLWHRLEEARGSPALDEASAEQQDLVMSFASSIQKSQDIK